MSHVKFTTESGSEVTFPIQDLILMNFVSGTCLVYSSTCENLEYYITKEEYDRLAEILCDED